MGGKTSKLFDAVRDPTNDQVVRQAFDSFDSDRNGVLEGQEVRQFALACLNVIKQDVKEEELFCRMSVRGALRSFTRDEFVLLLIEEANAICEWNESGNLELTYDKFEHFVLHHPGWESFSFLANVAKDAVDMKGDSGESEAPGSAVDFSAYLDPYVDGSGTLVTREGFSWRWEGPARKLACVGAPAQHQAWADGSVWFQASKANRLGLQVMPHGISDVTKQHAVLGLRVEFAEVFHDLTLSVTLSGHIVGSSGPVWTLGEREGDIFEHGCQLQGTFPAYLACAVSLIDNNAIDKGLRHLQDQLADVRRLALQAQRWREMPEQKRPRNVTSVPLPSVEEAQNVDLSTTDDSIWKPWWALFGLQK